MVGVVSGSEYTIDGWIGHLADMGISRWLLLRDQRHDFSQCGTERLYQFGWGDGNGITWHLRERPSKQLFFGDVGDCQQKGLRSEDGDLLVGTKPMRLGELHAAAGEAYLRCADRGETEVVVSRNGVNGLVIWNKMRLLNLGVDYPADQKSPPLAGIRTVSADAPLHVVEDQRVWFDDTPCPFVLAALVVNKDLAACPPGIENLQEDLLVNYLTWIREYLQGMDASAGKETAVTVVADDFVDRISDIPADVWREDVSGDFPANYDCQQFIGVEKSGEGEIPVLVKQCVAFGGEVEEDGAVVLAAENLNVVAKGAWRA